MLILNILSTNWLCAQDKNNSYLFKAQLLSTWIEYIENNSINNIENYFRYLEIDTIHFETMKELYNYYESKKKNKSIDFTKDFEKHIDNLINVTYSFQSKFKNVNEYIEYLDNNIEELKKEKTKIDSLTKIIKLTEDTIEISIDSIVCKNNYDFICANKTGYKYDSAKLSILVQRYPKIEILKNIDSDSLNKHKLIDIDTPHNHADTIECCNTTLKNFFKAISKKAEEHYLERIKKIDRKLIETGITKQNLKDIPSPDTPLDSPFTSSTKNLIKTLKGTNLPFVYVSQEEKQSSSTTLNVKGGIPISSIPTQTEMIDAIAILISNRFKEEVTLTFLNSFKKMANSDSIISILFPETANIFNAREIYSMPTIGSSWKASFGNDLINISNNIASYYQNKSQKIFDNDFRELFEMLVRMLNETKKGTSFIHVLDQPMYLEDSSIISAIKFFNDNLVDHMSEDNYFITWQKYNQLHNFSKMYFINRIKYKFNIEKEETKFDRHIFDVIASYNRLESQINFLNSLENKRNGLKDLTMYWSTIQDIIKNIVEILKSSEDDNKNIDKKLSIINNTINLQKGIENQNWGYLTIPLKEILTNIVCDNYWYCYNLNLNKNNLPKLDIILKANDELSKDYKKINNYKIINSTIDFISFLGDILSIKDSKELTELIHSKSIPSSSYRIKRNNSYTIDLNSYVGWSFGREFSKDSIKSGTTTGLSVPIGISLSIGNSRQIKKVTDNKLLIARLKKSKNTIEYRQLQGDNLSIFVSVVDLTAPVTFRLTNPNGSTLPSKVSFKQFFSPGIHLTYGFKNSPYTLMAGFQRYPSLRSFDKIDQNSMPASLNAINLTLAVDIPLFNFYSKR